MLTRTDAFIVCLDRILLIIALAVITYGSFTPIPVGYKVAALVPAVLTSSYLIYRSFQLSKLMVKSI
jgi:hypothetical protein